MTGGRQAAPALSATASAVRQAPRHARPPAGPEQPRRAFGPFPAHRLRLLAVLALAIVAAVAAATFTLPHVLSSGSRNSPSLSSPRDSPSLPVAEPTLYSSPEFCITTQSGSPPCLNATLGGTVPGTVIQTWGRTTVADPDSRFEAFPIGAGLVTKVAPFKEDFALNSSFAGYEVVEFEAFTGSHLNGQCISTKGAYKQQAADGKHYYYGPITLQSCDSQNDDNDTWAVWDSGGSVAYPITMVSLSDTTGSPQQLACVPDGSIIRCGKGTPVVTVTAGAPSWAHFQECTLASSAQPQARCTKSSPATGPSSTTSPAA